MQCHLKGFLGCVDLRHERFDGLPMRSCLMFAVQANGCELSTIEGLGTASGDLSPLQRAMHEQIRVTQQDNAVRAAA